MMASIQKLGGLACYVDLEHTFDPEFAAKLGVIVDELIISQPGSLQEAFAVIDEMIEAGVDVIAVDSVAALVPKEELDAEVGKQTVGLVARYMSQFLKRVTKKLADHNNVLLFVNQTRQNIGQLYGDPTTTTGGGALKFYSSIRIRVGKGKDGLIKAKQPDGTDEIIGINIKTKCVKNKTAPPYKQAEFYVYFDGREVDESDEIAMIAMNKSLIPRYNAKGELVANGKFYKWPDEPEFLAKKRDDVAKEIRKFPKVKEALKQIIQEGSYTKHAYTYDEDEIEDDDFDSIVEEEEEQEVGLTEAEESDEGLDWTTD